MNNNYGPPEQGLRHELIKEVDDQLMLLADLVSKLSIHESRYMTLNSVPYAHLCRIVHNHYVNQSSHERVHSCPPEDRPQDQDVLPPR